MRILSRLGASTLLICFFTALSLKAEDRTIAIRMLSSKTGKPITSTELQIFHSPLVGSSGIWIKPDTTGEFHFSAPASLTDMRVYAVYGKASWSYIGCDIHKGNVPTYAISQILRDGVVAANYCSRKKATAVPGEFVFFVREMTFLEKFHS
jgi:hypothetical protein